MDKNIIIKTLQEIKPKYAKDGIELLGLFGSYAQNRQNKFSDIDIVYKLDYDKFSKKYKGGFAKLLKLDEIKEDLQKIFKKSIDLVPNNNIKILNKVIYV